MCVCVRVCDRNDYVAKEPYVCRALLAAEKTMKSSVYIHVNVDIDIYIYIYIHI